MALISVIIPLYKSAPFITATLDSVLGQTHHDIEVLCIDDCSPDNTAEIVKEYIQRDDRVRYIRHAENKGAPAFGRNTGLEQARGEYVTFLDHDDTFLPTKLEELLVALKENNVQFICSNIHLVNNKTGKVDGEAWGTVTGDSQGGFARRLLQGNFVPPNSTLIHREVFNSVGVFDTSLRGVDDYDMWYRIARVFPARVYPKSLATWRYLNSESISANDELMIRDEINFYTKIVEEPDWSLAEKEGALTGIKRGKKMLANRLLVKKEYQAATVLYREAEIGWAATACSIVPALLRSLYLVKLKRNIAFKPLDLNFS